MSNYNIYDDVNQQTNCIDLARELGLVVTSGGMLRCPDPAHEDQTPSCKVYTDGYYCFGCGARGSVIDLYMHVRGVDLITASWELAARAGLTWPERGEDARQEYAQQLDRQAQMEKRVTAWAKTLRPENTQYLKERGFTEEFIKEQGFGCCAQAHPQDEALARELGLLVSTEIGRDWYLPGGRLTIPFWRYGKVAQVAFHKPGGEPKYLYPTGWTKPLLVSAKRGVRPFLVEGVFDYYSLLQANLPAVAGLGTQLSQEQKAELARVLNFYICFDGDEAGRKAAAALAKEFYPAARVINLPDGKDVNDMLRELGVDALRAYLQMAAAGAKDYLELLLDVLAADPKDAQVRQEVIVLIAALPGDVDRDLQIDRLAKLLKSCGIGKAAIRADVALLRKQSQGEGQQAEPEKDTQAQALLALAAQAAFFHTPEGTGYVTVPVAEHKETWPIKSSGFRRWLVRQFFAVQEKPPSAQALQDTLAVLEAKAFFDGTELAVFTRLAEVDGKIYLDTCNAAWEVVEVTQDGWQVVSEYPVKFRRTNGMLPLPLPVQGGDIKDLRQFVNVGSEADWCLLVAWAVAALRPSGPYPVLTLHGEQGSAKSTAVRVLRALIDPATAPMRTTPRDERDLAIAACNAWVIAYDNLSGLPSWLSDALCRVATGGGFATRTLYSDNEESIFDYTRPIVINGIDEIVARHDLLDRSLLLTLPVIPEAGRRDEAAFWADFEQARPLILGALLDAVAVGLRDIAGTRLAALPRMADFAKWVVACEPALPWAAGAFLGAYAGKRAEAVEAALEADPVAVAVKALLAETEPWEGTATELLAALEKYVAETTTRAKSWPKSARGIGNRLRRAATFLRHAGVEVEFVREANTSRRRLIRISTHSIVHNVHIVQDRQENHTRQDFADWTQNWTQTDFGRNTSSNTVFASKEKTNDTNGLDDVDVVDAKKQDFSNGNTTTLPEQILTAEGYPASWDDT